MQYFVDTNIVIDFLNKKEEAINLLTNIAKDEENILYTNRLVNLESLRTIPMKNTRIFKTAQKILESFEQLDITVKIYNDTIEFSRFFKTVKHQSLKGKCEAIDLLHFMTAKHYGLKLISYDKDFDNLEIMYQEFLKDNR